METTNVQALVDSARQKDALYQLADRLHRTQSLTDIYDAALHAIFAALQCDRASILLFDEQHMMRFVHWQELSEGYRKATDGHSPWTIEDRNPLPVCMNDVAVAELQEPLKTVIANEGIGALAFVPLVADGTLIGKFMAYFNAPHAFTTDEIELSLTIARQLAFGIARKRDEEALRSSESLYRATFDNAAIGIAHVGLDGRWLRFNDATCTITGYTRAQLGAKTFTDITHPEDIEGDWAEARRLIAGEISTYTREKRYVRNDGSAIWIRLTVSLMRDAAGAAQHFISIIEDIDQRKHTEQLLHHNANQLALITNTAPVFIAYCDTEARFKFVNDGYAQRFGLKPRDCTGRRIPEIIGEQAYAALRPYVEIALRGQPIEFEVAVAYKSIGERFMHCSYAPEIDHDGNVVGFVGAIMDITERKRVEDALQKSEEQLKEADRNKDEFLAMLAHELRNPLAPLSNGLRVLKIKGNDAQSIEWSRSMMERQLAHMVRLIDDLLDVSRISRGKVELRKDRIELSKILQHAVETSRPPLEAGGQVLDTSMPADPIHVEADFARLAQVIANLLNNACKFSSTGGRIWLTVERDGDQVMVRVRDSGIGIAADQFSRIFELFAQVDNSLERTRHGLGIGLTLAKKLTEMHGGSVEVHSAGIGKGSEFVVRLPVAGAAQTVLAPASHTAPTNTASRCVLVVDDNVDAAHSLAMFLNLNGHTTHIANDGVEAVQAATAFKPDLVLLDIGLPKLNGYEVARHIRDQPWGRDISIIALTGWGQDHDRARSKDAGFDHHLVKPVDLDVLTQLMARKTATV